MPTHRKTYGSGLTEGESFVFSGKLTSEEQALNDELAQAHTVDGRLAQIETACASVLRKAGLPERSGNYLVNTSGDWEIADALRYEWTYTRCLWTIAQRRGHAPDSQVGFAARMVDDILFLRERRASGNADGALMMMFYLGVKWSASGIKERHGSKSRPLSPARKYDRDIAMAREFERRKQEGTRLSDTALMEDIGSKQQPPISRSSAVEAIKRGRNFLSG